MCFHCKNIAYTLLWDTISRSLFKGEKQYTSNSDYKKKINSNKIFLKNKKQKAGMWCDVGSVNKLAQDGLRPRECHHVQGAPTPVDH